MVQPKSRASHDTGLEYLEVDEGAPEDFSVARSGSSVRVEGICPRCSGFTRSTFRVASPDRTPRSRALLHRLLRRRWEGDEREERVAQEATVFCECGAVHEKRPDSATDAGCGAYWVVKL